MANPEDSLRDSLTSAFEAAEESSEPTPTVQAEPPEEPAEAPSRSRDEGGRFAKEPPKEPPKEAPAATAEQPKIERKAPASWKREVAEKWGLIDPEIQSEIERRESDFLKGIQEFKGHADRARAYEQAIAPYMGMIQQAGVDPIQAITRLFQADQRLRTASPAEKAQYLLQLAQEYGAPLEHLQNPPQIDPTVAHLQGQLRQMQERQEMLLRAQHEQVQSAINSEIAAFREGKEHFEAVRNVMASLMESGQAKTMQEAYDMAIYANPQTRAALLESQRKEAERKAVEQQHAQRARTAAASVKGSTPASGTSSAPKGSLRAELEAAFDNS